MVEKNSFEIEISEIDFRLILNVKKIREHQGISQMELSQSIGLSSGFIGKVEKLDNEAKYNIRHLPLLVKALNLKSIGDLFPQDEILNDLVRIKIKKAFHIKSDGSLSKNRFDYQVLEIKSLKKDR